MTSSYTTNKNIEKPANGDYNNTWSVPVNSDWDVIDKAFGGTTTINAVGASGTVTLTTTQYQPPIIAITGALTANVNYQLPSGVGGFWYIFNNTSGAFSVLLSSAGGGSTVTLPQGYTIAVISDGTNIGLGTTNAALISSTYANPSWITSLATSKLTGSVAVTNGGTGGTTQATARSGIGAAASGANTDITSIAPTGNLTFSPTGNLTLSPTTGTLVGSPTGGVQGAGTINATGLFVNGVPVGTSTGSVSSVSGSGGTTGLTLTGGPITTSGTLTLGGTLGVANGGTGGTSQATAQSALGVPSTTGSGASGNWGINITGNAATATTATSATTATNATNATNAVNATNATNATTATTAGNVSGVVAILNGGTGNTTAAAALAALGGLGATASALSDPGYITLTNGLTIQWGSYFHSADTYLTITFPVAFATGCYSVVSAGASEAGNVNAQANGSAPNTVSTASFQAWNAGSSRTYWYIAIGS